MKRIRVCLKNNSYPVLIGNGILQVLGKELRKVRFPGKVLVVTNPGIARLYLNRVTNVLKKENFKVFTFAGLPANESAKSGAGLFSIYKSLLRWGLDRSSGLIALGGGVVGDVAGFAAATFMRGIPWAGVPTTLLAQVDSAIGGKTAINLPEGKNLAGIFYQPRLVLSDVAVLKTLPDREIRNALAEVIKYGVIRDPSFFAYLEKNIGKACRKDFRVLEKIVTVCAAIKAEVVSEDEKEVTGARAVLNYGHTFAHGFEAASGKWSISHGEAVAMGMRAAAELAASLALLSGRDAERQKNLIEKAGLPAVLPGKLKTVRVLKCMSHDKKKEKGTLKFVLPVKIGKVQIYRSIPPSFILEALGTIRSR